MHGMQTTTAARHTESTPSGSDPAPVVRPRPPAPGSPELRAMHRDTGIRLPELDRHLPTNFSASSLNSYLRCARQWMYERVYRLQTVPHVNATAGTHAHRVLERLMDEPGPDRTLDRAREIHDEVVAKLDDALTRLLAVEDPDERRLLAREIGRDDPDLSHVGEVVEVLDERDVFDRRTVDALHGYFELSKDPAAVDLVGTEHDLETTFDTPSGPLPFRAIVDRVDRLPDRFGGGLMVVDYKTGKAVDPRWDDGAYRRQILLYAAAVEQVHGELPSHGLLLYVNAREVKQVRITRDAVDEVVAMAGRVWATLQHRSQDDSHDPAPSPLCGWCPVVDLCDEGGAEMRRRAEVGTGPGGLRIDAPARHLLDLWPDDEDREVA